ncbi:MAG: hypothetical protein H0W55_09720 [Actinobacteria bacterium]|nr:hypothetical protein [Actinomycetota bacterium]MDQ3533613.1 hypothetical protein [Actinomycetota bacterium]
MVVSRASRAVIVLVAVVGLLVYLAIIDLGVSAGRIHHGVSVQGIDVGGLTETEAVRVLESNGRKRRETRLYFGREGLRRLSFTPKEIGWWPRAEVTAASAMEIGREGSPIQAVLDRARGWLGGVAIGWTGAPRAGKVDRVLDRWEGVARKHGLDINRGFLRYKIRRAVIFQPPQSLFRVPLVTDGP